MRFPPKGGSPPPGHRAVLSALFQVDTEGFWRSGSSCRWEEVSRHRNGKVRVSLCRTMLSKPEPVPSLPREESLERGHQSRFAFPLGPLPRPVGSKIRRRGELGCCLESVGWASLQGSLRWREKDAVDVHRRADRLTVTPLGHHQLAFLAGSSSTWGCVKPDVPGPSLQPDRACQLLRGGPLGWEPRALGFGQLLTGSRSAWEGGYLWITFILGNMFFLGERVRWGQMGWSVCPQSLVTDIPRERVETHAFFLTRRKADEINMKLLLQKLKSNVENESS